MRHKAAVYSSCIFLCHIAVTVSGFIKKSKNRVVVNISPLAPGAVLFMCGLGVTLQHWVMLYELTRSHYQLTRACTNPSSAGTAIPTTLHLSVCLPTCVFSGVSHFLFILKTLHLSLCLLTSYKPLLSSSSFWVSSSSLILSEDRLPCFALRHRTLSDRYKRSIL